MSKFEVEANVLSFIDKAAEHYGKFKEKEFAQEMYQNCIECGIKSPIERLFWTACHALCAPAHIEVNPEPFFNSRGEINAGFGIFVKPQVKVGSYTVDFIVSQNGIGPDEILTPVVVELDGHDFHDKDKRQRSYEKARDRFLVKQRYRVLHFTGSDVVADPFKVAHEVLCMVGYDVCTFSEYNKKDPLGLESM